MDAFSVDTFKDALDHAFDPADEELAHAGMAASVQRLRAAGLRPTRQRVMLAELLFANGDRHVTAEMLFGEACDANIHLSVATVYNTLNQFTQAGLLRRIGPDGSKSFFDTNTSVHPHFYLQDEDALIDIPETLVLDRMPDALPGHEISRLDIIIHIRRRPARI